MYFLPFPIWSLCLSVSPSSSSKCMSFCFPLSFQSCHPLLLSPTRYFFLFLYLSRIDAPFFAMAALRSVQIRGIAQWRSTVRHASVLPPLTREQPSFAHIRRNDYAKVHQNALE